MKRIVLARGSAAVLFLALFSAALPASAGKSGGAAEEGELSAEQKEEAKSAFLAGSASFREGDFRRAIEHFRRAFEIARSPEIIYNIGRCYEELHEEEDAIYHYEMFLRFYPTAEDAEDVRHRINMLRALEGKPSAAEGGAAAPAGGAPPPETAPAEAETEGGAKGEPPKKNAWYTGMRVALDIGAIVPLLTKWEQPVVPIDVLVHYPLLDWLFITAAITFGVGVVQDADRYPDEVENEIALFVGLGGYWRLGKVVALTGRLGARVAGLSRQHHDMVTWIPGELGLGLAFEVSGSWRILIESVTAYGPLIDPEGKTGWGADTPPALVVGGNLGAEYRF